MLKLLVLALIALLILSLTRPGLGFKAQKPADYASEGPVFDIRTHLKGVFVAEGMIYGPRGKVVSRFLADLAGSWDGNSGRLSETFTYSTGTVQKRNWSIVMGQDGAFVARAEDIIGEATGQQMGSAVRLHYRIRLPAASGGHVLDVTDWMYLLDNGTIVNRSQMRKFGIKVGELFATIRPVGT